MSRWLTPSASIRSGRSGRRALAQSRSTFPGVSSPCSVVKSMQVIARSNHAACHSFFTVRRVGMVAARRSTALRLTRRPRMTSRSSGMPGLRSSWGGGTGRATPTGRSRSDVTFMLAGECGSLLEKSTRDGNSRALTARVDGVRLLRAEALLLARRQVREQRGDFFAQRMIARRSAGLIRDDLAKGERRGRRGGPIHERLHRTEVAGGTVGLSRLMAEIGRLLRIAQRVRRDVATQALKADGTHARGRACAGFRRVAEVAVIQIQHNRRLHLVA